MMPRISVHWRDAGAIFLIALALRLALALSLPAGDSVFWDQPYLHYARNFAEGRGFWMPNPYSEEVDLPRVYAFRPPLFPFLWGCVYKITGGAYAPIRIAFAILGAATCALAYVIGLDLTRRRAVALTGGLLCACYPPLVWHSVHLMTEPMFIFFSTLALWLLFRLRRTGLARWALLAGIVGGLATLTRSALVAFLPVAAVWVWVFAGRNTRALRHAGIFCAAVLAVMMPWIVRNALVFKAFVPTTTDAGHGFYVANNAHSLADPRGFWIPEDWSFVKEHPEERPNEVEISQRLMRMSARYLMEHPREAAALMAKRFVTLWRFWPHREFVSPRHVLLYAISYLPLFPFILAGLWLAHRRAGEAMEDVLLIDALILYTTAIHVVFLAMMRYREPLMPFLLVFAGLAIVTAWERWIMRKAPAAS